MEFGIIVGGNVAAAVMRDRRVQSSATLEKLFGKYLAETLLRDKSLLPLVLPVLHSDGKDAEAVLNLKFAIFRGNY